MIYWNLWSWRGIILSYVVTLIVHICATTYYYTWFCDILYPLQSQPWRSLRWQVRQEAAALLGEFGSARKQQLRRQQAPRLGEGWLFKPMQKKIRVCCIWYPVCSEIAKVEVLSFYTFYRCSLIFSYFFSLVMAGPVLFVSLDAEAYFWGSAPSWMTSSATFVTMAAVILKRCWWDHYGLTFTVVL